jgi:alkanesulfonate monooxygenase SsuD/methylene tetrahydromethanopterin reductase-like flavin-dependent oxidoreductase (luciferase family)
VASAQGEFYQIPKTAIWPRPVSHPEKRVYASSVSPESPEIMAKLGFGILVVMQMAESGREHRRLSRDSTQCRPQPAAASDLFAPA